MFNIFFSIAIIIFTTLVIICCTCAKIRENFEDFDVFLVSLEKDKDRRENVLKHIKPDFIYAVDGSKLDLDQLKKEGKIKDSTMKRGEIGCFMSHIFLLEKALKNKKNVLILEDDVELDDKSLSKMRQAITKMPKDCELLFFGYNYYEKYGETIDYKTELIKLVHGTHAYFVNIKNITKEKIDKVYPLKGSYDIYVPSHFKTYIVLPKVCELDEIFCGHSNTQGIE
jgi:hypothetical protein